MVSLRLISITADCAIVAPPGEDMIKYGGADKAAMKLPVFYKL